MISVNSGVAAIRPITLDELRKLFIFVDDYVGQERVGLVIKPSKDSILKKDDIVFYAKDLYLHTAEEIESNCFYIYESDVEAILDGEIIIPLRDFVFVETDADEFKSTNIGGVNFRFDDEYSSFKDGLTKQSGKVISVPRVALDPFTLEPIEVKIKKGDTVYCLQKLTHEDNCRIINGKKVYQIIYEDCYCVERNGKIIMLNEWNLLEPIDNEVENIGSFEFIEKKKVDNRFAKVSFICDKLSSFGVKVGDVVAMKDNRDYPLIINEKKYYRVSTRSIVGIK